MATYTELRDLFSDDTLQNRVDVATMIAANNLLGGTPTAAEQSWAANVFANPRGESTKAYRAVLATNNGLTVAQITGATDAALQTAVDSVVDTLVIANGV